MVQNGADMLWKVGTYEEIKEEKTFLHRNVFNVFTYELFYNNIIAFARKRLYTQTL